MSNTTLRRLTMPTVGAVAAALLAVTGTTGATANPSTTPARTPDYRPDPDSLDTHPVPEWFDDDKFGIFIHWGAYSVPAWGPRGSYAEWYGNYLYREGGPTYEHHRATYGEDYDYDRFIDDWKAERFDPDAWVDLFKEAGAKYFVLTSKHHEGVALWDTATSTRDTVDRGPRRDLVGDLFAAARRDGALKAGLYYSLYEWFNPNYNGQQPTNPFTGAPIDYTGVPPVDDYVHDYMQPQIRELIDKYDPDMLWCDGQWDRPAAYWDMAPVIADYYNQAKNRPQPKEVAVANRCKTRTGDLDSPELDFQTPEYSVKPDIDPVKWEASRGIAHSYGYNQNEPVEDYLTSDQLVDSLVDIVSKNGNLLLDVGPRADGTIPQVQAERLRDIGAWLKTNGEAIYGTTYYNRAEEPASDVPIRYTVKDGALYATALAWPGEQLTLGGDLPFDTTTEVRLLGGNGKALPWRRTSAGEVVVRTPARASAPSQHAYVFKISTPGVRQLVRTRFDLPAETPPGTQVDATLHLTNTGREESPDVRVAVDVPDGWTAAPAATVVRAIPAGETIDVPVRISVPADAPSGDNTVRVSTSVGRLRTLTEAQLPVVLPNVAEGKVATQSSTAYDAPPSRAVDGNTDGSFDNGSVTHTAEPSNQAWWQVDLGRSHPIDEVSVWNRTDCCSDRLSDYWLIVSDDPITAASVEEARSAPGVTAIHQDATAGRPTRIRLDGLSGRYVRVQLESDVNPLSLAEVQVRSAG